MPVVVVLASVSVIPAFTRADGPALAGRPTDSVFFIEKSENRNQVHYGVRVDRNCAPLGDKPVYGYWRNFEEGQDARSSLLLIEQPAYGITNISSRARTGGGGSAKVVMRSLANRNIVIDTFATPEGCRAIAATHILKQVAELRSIYVKLGGLFALQVDRVLLRGARISTRAELVETLRPSA